MPPPKFHNDGKAYEAFEEVNVLVTGFGPFASIHENPSWSIASSLPPLLPANAAHPSRIRIVVHPFPVAVSYKAVHDLIPAVFATGSRADVILHIGVAESRDHYSLERIGRRDGYIRLDTTGELAKGVEPAYWGDCPAELQTHIRMEDIMKRWQSVVPTEDVRVSEDAGRFLCDYILYASLAFFHREEDQKRPWQERTAVAFLHVPPHFDQASIKKGRDVAIALLYALVDSRRQRDGDYVDEKEG